MIAIIAPIAGGQIDQVDTAVGEVFDAADGACTGTLIAPHVVLTAAHCTEAAPLMVALDDGVYNVIAVATPPTFDPVTLTSDLAVLVLDHDSTLAPLALSTLIVAAGTPAVLVGFGRDENGDSGDRRSATVAIADVLGPRFEISGPANACAGDSGGPTLVTGAIAGVVSSGDPTCGTTSDHTRVRAFIPWVLATAPSATTDAPAPADTPPSIAITRPGTGATMPDTFALGVALADDYGAVAASFAIDSGASTEIQVTGDALSIPIAIAPGDHELAVTTVDASGNTATASIALTIEPPIHDPGSIGAACWDDTDCDAGDCNAAHVCADPDEHVGGGGCSTTPHPGWLLVMIAALRMARSRTRAT